MCSYRSAISAYHEAIGSFTIIKHPHVNNLMTGIFNNGYLNQVILLFGMLKQ